MVPIGRPTTLRSAASALRTWDVSIGLDGRRTARYLRRARAAGARGSSPTAHVLVAPPGRGNLGDQCMVEAFLENTTLPVVLVTRYVDDLIVPTIHADRVTVVPIDGLLYGRGRDHARAIETFGSLLRDARSVSIIGADIMDGAYNLRASVRRAALAAGSRAAGVNTRILGFSWNDHPRRPALAAVRAAASAGTTMYLRDPVSAERARADGVVGVVDAADIVFASTSISSDARRRLVPSGKRYAVVNVSGMLAKTSDQTADHARIVTHLVGSGLDVVLLPHVIRASGDDLTACRKVLVALDGAHNGSVTLVEDLLTPADVRGLTADATVVVTGRMHLAINALWSGVPAIVLATQGKVEGLARLFGRPDLCVNPRPNLADRVIRTADLVLESLSTVVDGLSARSNDARALSNRNFNGLELRSGSTSTRH